MDKLLSFFGSSAARESLFKQQQREHRRIITAIEADISVLTRRCTILENTATRKMLEKNRPAALEIGAQIKTTRAQIATVRNSLTVQIQLQGEVAAASAASQSMKTMQKTAAAAASISNGLDHKTLTKDVKKLKTAHDDIIRTREHVQLALSVCIGGDNDQPDDDDGDGDNDILQILSDLPGGDNFKLLNLPPVPFGNLQRTRPHNNGGGAILAHNV